MRTIDRSSAFKRDYRREANGRYRATLDDELKSVLVALANDQPLDARYRDHDLSGDCAGSALASCRRFWAALDGKFPMLRRKAIVSGRCW